MARIGEPPIRAIRAIRGSFLYRSMTVRRSPYRVIQWATGAVGVHALRSLIEDPDFDLVGLYVHDPAKVGRDAGELAGVTARTGIVATDDAARLLATEADCVVYTAVGETRPRAAVAEIAALLRSGKNVVSTSMMNLIHPASANPKVTVVLDEACTAGGTTLFTNGIDPGFSGDLMPLAALALCERVESIRVQELADYGTHPDASWATPFGFGQPPDAAAPILLPECRRCSGAAWYGCSPTRCTSHSTR